MSKRASRAVRPKAVKAWAPCWSDGVIVMHRIRATAEAAMADRTESNYCRAIEVEIRPVRPKARKRKAKRG